MITPKKTLDIHNIPNAMINDNKDLSHRVVKETPAIPTAKRKNKNSNRKIPTYPLQQNPQ